MTTSSIIIVYLLFLLYSVSGLFIGHINKLTEQYRWLSYKSSYDPFDTLWMWSSPYASQQTCINNEMQYYARRPSDTLKELDPFEVPGRPLRTYVEELKAIHDQGDITV